MWGKSAITATKFAAGLAPKEFRYNESSRKTSVTDMRMEIMLKELSYLKVEAVLLTRW